MHRNGHESKRELVSAVKMRTFILHLAERLNLAEGEVRRRLNYERVRCPFSREELHDTTAKVVVIRLQHQQEYKLVLAAVREQADKADREVAHADVENGELTQFYRQLLGLEARPTRKQAQRQPQSNGHKPRVKRRTRHHLAARSA